MESTSDDFTNGSKPSLRVCDFFAGKRELLLQSSTFFSELTTNVNFGPSDILYFS